MALTFDDGPDGRWTPKILDILKQKHANATFFVIGENMQDAGSGAARRCREGDIVGNRTMDPTPTSAWCRRRSEAAWRLSTAQRLFAVLTGLVRHGCSGPAFLRRRRADPRRTRSTSAVIAPQLGYLVVGLRIDPDDWQREPSGLMPAPDVIVQRVVDRLAVTGQFQGQVVLLRALGGDRSQTVAALPKLIDALRARGLKLVTVDQLAGMTRAQAMPPTSRNSVELLLDRLGFGFFRYMDLHADGRCSSSPVVLGVARPFFLATLALYHRLTAGPRRADAGPDEPGRWSRC